MKPTIPIRTNTLFPHGTPPAPENGRERKQLTALGQRAEECLIRALAESHLNEAVRREVGRVWGEYKVAMERALHQMVEAAVDEMLTTKESFAKLQEVVNRSIREDRQVTTNPQIEGLRLWTQSAVTGLLGEVAELQTQIRDLEAKCVVGRKKTK